MVRLHHTILADDCSSQVMKCYLKRKNFYFRFTHQCTVAIGVGHFSELTPTNHRVGQSGHVNEPLNTLASIERRLFLRSKLRVTALLVDSLVTMLPYIRLEKLT